MNVICETVTLVESNITFDADVSHALPLAVQTSESNYAVLNSFQIEASKVHFHSQIPHYSNYIVNRIVYLRDESAGGADNLRICLVN